MRHGLGHLPRVRAQLVEMGPVALDVDWPAAGAPQHGHGVAVAGVAEQQPGHAAVDGGELRRRCPGWAVGGGILESSPASGVVELRSVSLGGSASAWHGAAAGCVVVGDLRVNVELGFGDGALGFAAGLGVGGDRVGLGLGTRRGLGLGDQLEPGLGALLGGQSWSRLWHAGRTAKPGFKARRAALRGRGGS